MTGMTTGVLTDLLRSLEGLRQRRAIILLLGGLAAAGVLVAIGAQAGIRSSSFGVATVFGVLSVLCACFGMSSAGIVVMDVTRGRAPSSYSDAILLGSIAFLKLLAGVIGFALAFLGVHLVIWALLFICKIPGLGPVLLAIILPAILLLVALLYIAIGACFSLLAPALWDGNTLGAAFARVYAIGTKRPFEFIVVWFAASLLLVFISSALLGVLSGATLSVGGLTASVLGFNLESIGMMGLSEFGGGFGSRGRYGGGMGGGDIGGYLLAGMFGVSVAWAIAFAAFGSVALMAMCLIYAGLVDGLDTKEAEQYLADRISVAKQKAADLQEAAKQRAQEAQARAWEASQQRAAAAAAASSAPRPSPLPRCPKCGAQVEAGQVFCGECGHRLG